MPASGKSDRSRPPLVFDVHDAVRDLPGSTAAGKVEDARRAYLDSAALHSTERFLDLAHLAPVWRSASWSDRVWTD